jgi:hypothetical protein
MTSSLVDVIRATGLDPLAVASALGLGPEEEAPDQDEEAPDQAKRTARAAPVPRPVSKPVAAAARGEAGVAALMAMANRTRHLVGRPVSHAAGSLEDTIKNEWRKNPAIRQEFSTFETYAAWRRQQHCKAAGLSFGDLVKQEPNVSAYVATIEARGAALTSAERASIETHAATWKASADIRREFVSFPAFASYMRAKERGRVRKFGV